MEKKEILKRVLLYMNYDSKKTLSENYNIVGDVSVKTETYCLDNKEKYTLKNGKDKDGNVTLATLNVIPKLCFEPKQGSKSKNTSAVAKNKEPFTDAYPLVFDCAKRHSDSIFIVPKERLNTDMNLYGPKFTKGSYVGFKKEDQEPNTKSLIENLYNSFCLTKKENLDEPDKKSINSDASNWENLFKKLNDGGYPFYVTEKTTPLKDTQQFLWGRFTIKKKGGLFITWGLSNQYWGVITNNGGKYNGEEIDKLTLQTNVPNKPTMTLKEFLDNDFINQTTVINKETPKKDKVGTGGQPEVNTQSKTQTKPKTQTKTQTKTQVEYIDCNGTYSYGCKSPKIEEAQKCLKDQGLYTKTVDGKFGGNTLKAVKSKINKTYFTDSDIPTICGRKQEERKSDSGSTPGGGSKKEEEYVWNGKEI